MTTVASLMY